MRWFFCGNIGGTGSGIELDAGERKHIFKVLRAVPGDRFVFTDGHGTVAEAEVAADREITVASVETRPAPNPRLHLLVAPPKRPHMDQLLRQCAEAGVWSIIPVITDRRVVEPKEKSNSRQEAILLEACKQAHNPWSPKMEPPMKLAEALKMLNEKGIPGCFGAVENTAPENLPSGDDIAWLVGPEGGFTGQEEDLMRGHGMVPLNLGDTVMRVETAAVAGVVILRFPRKRMF